MTNYSQIFTTSMSIRGKKHFTGRPQLIIIDDPEDDKEFERVGMLICRHEGGRFEFHTFLKESKRPLLYDLYMNVQEYADGQMRTSLLTVDLKVLAFHACVLPDGRRWDAFNGLN